MPSEVPPVRVSEINSQLFGKAGGLHKWPVGEVRAKITILCAFLLLLIFADLDSSEVKTFWEANGFSADLDFQIASEIFIRYSEIFLSGPLAKMANMTVVQSDNRRKDSGILLDGIRLLWYAAM